MGVFNQIERRYLCNLIYLSGTYERMHADSDADIKGKYGFIGTVTDLDKAAVKVNVQVKE